MSSSESSSGACGRVGGGERERRRRRRRAVEVADAPRRRPYSVRLRPSGSAASCGTRRTNGCEPEKLSRSTPAMPGGGAVPAPAPPSERRRRWRARRRAPLQLANLGAARRARVLDRPRVEAAVGAQFEGARRQTAERRRRAQPGGRRGPLRVGAARHDAGGHVGRRLRLLHEGLEVAARLTRGAAAERAGRRGVEHPRRAARRVAARRRAHRLRRRRLAAQIAAGPVGRRRRRERGARRRRCARVEGEEVVVRVNVSPRPPRLRRRLGLEVERRYGLVAEVVRRGDGVEVGERDGAERVGERRGARERRRRHLGVAVHSVGMRSHLWHCVLSSPPAAQQSTVRSSRGVELRIERGFESMIAGAVATLAALRVASRGRNIVARACLAPLRHHRPSGCGSDLRLRSLAAAGPRILLDALHDAASRPERPLALLQHSSKLRRCVKAPQCDLETLGDAKPRTLGIVSATANRLQRVVRRAVRRGRADAAPHRAVAHVCAQ